MNLNELREAMASDATKENASLMHDCVRWWEILEEITELIQML